MCDICLRNDLDIRYGKNMFEEESDTQRWARCALKILVERAQDRRTIKFSELTDELGLEGRPYNVLMARVCRHIIKTLAELEMRDNWQEGEIPHITSIVTDKNGEWSSNMWKAIKNRWEAITGDSNSQPRSEQRQIELNCSFCYERWDTVLAALFRENTP